MLQSSNGSEGNQFDNNAEYFEGKAVSKICSTIDRVGAKYGRKIGSKELESAKRYILDMHRETVSTSQTLQYYLDAFEKNIRDVGRFIFPVAIPDEMSGDGLLTPHQINRMVYQYKIILEVDGLLPDLKSCSDLMWCDVLVTTEIESLAWLLVANRMRYLNCPEKVLTKREQSVFLLYMYQYIVAKLHVLKTNLEADVDLIPTLHVQPNVRKFSEHGQTMQLALEDTAVVVYNLKKGIIGVINITDQLSKKELLEEFIEISASKTNPEEQEVIIFQIASEREEQVIHETFQKIAATLHGLDWAHDEEPDLLILTMNYFEDMLAKKGYVASDVRMYGIDKDRLDEYNNAVVTLDLSSGIYVDIVNQKTGEYTNEVEVDF